MPVIDFTNVEERSFDPLPVGRYDLTITKASVEPGNEFPYLALEFEIMDGEYKGRKLFENCSFAPLALWKFKSLLRAAGYGDDELSGSFEFEADDLVETEVGAKVGTRKDQEGETRNVIKSYFAL